MKNNQEGNQPQSKGLWERIKSFFGANDIQLAQKDLVLSNEQVDELGAAVEKFINPQQAEQQPAQPQATEAGSKKKTDMSESSDTEAEASDNCNDGEDDEDSGDMKDNEKTKAKDTKAAEPITSPTPQSEDMKTEERFDKIEATLDRLAEILLKQTAQQPTAAEQQPAPQAQQPVATAEDFSKLKALETNPKLSDKDTGFKATAPTPTIIRVGSVDVNVQAAEGLAETVEVQQLTQAPEIINQFERAKNISQNPSFTSAQAAERLARERGGKIYQPQAKTR